MIVKIKPPTARKDNGYFSASSHAANEKILYSSSSDESFPSRSG
jgi:hypothetical protein